MYKKKGKENIHRMIQNHCQDKIAKDVLVVHRQDALTHTDDTFA